jgi:hypothetical protein
MIHKFKNFRVNEAWSQHMSASVFYSTPILMFGHFADVGLLAYSLCVLIAIIWELLQKFRWGGNNTPMKMIKGFLGLMVVPTILSLILNFV